MRKIISTFAIGTVVAAFASACAVDTSTAEADFELEPVGTSEAASCTNSQGTNAMIAALAVAIGRELKRWKLSTDFTVVTGAYNQQHLALTSTGLAQCSNGCANVKALLFFQDARYDNQIVFPDGQKLSSWSYAARLVAGYNEQRVCESRPSTNQNANNCPAEEHKLTLAYTSPGACDVNYTFNARTPQGGMLKYPALLKNRLLWTGGNNNPYVAFTSTNSTVTIDPTWGLNDGDNTTSGSCQSVCSKVSTKQNLTGACCKVAKHGKTHQGKMAKTANPAVFKCQVPACN